MPIIFWMFFLIKSIWTNTADKAYGYACASNIVDLSVPQASRTVINSADITFQMLEDWRNVDLNSITKQTLYTMEDSQEEHRQLIIHCKSTHLKRMLPVVVLIATSHGQTLYYHTNNTQRNNHSHDQQHHALMMETKRLNKFTLSWNTLWSISNSLHPHSFESVVTGPEVTNMCKLIHKDALYT